MFIAIAIIYSSQLVNQSITIHLWYLDTSRKPAHFSLLQLAGCAPGFCSSFPTDSQVFSARITEAQEGLALDEPLILFLEKKKKSPVEKHVYWQCHSPVHEGISTNGQVHCGQEELHIPF